MGRHVVHDAVHVAGDVQGEQARQFYTVVLHDWQVVFCRKYP